MYICLLLCGLPFSCPQCQESGHFNEKKKSISICYSLVNADCIVRDGLLFCSLSRCLGSDVFDAYPDTRATARKLSKQMHIFFLVSSQIKKYDQYDQNWIVDVFHKITIETNQPAYGASAMPQTRTKKNKNLVLNASRFGSDMVGR